MCIRDRVNNDAGTNQLGQLELINSTAGSIEMQRAIQVGTNMVGVGEDCLLYTSRCV